MSGKALDDQARYDDTYLVIHEVDGGYVVKVCGQSGPAKMVIRATRAAVLEFVNGHEFKRLS